MWRRKALVICGKEEVIPLAGGNYLSILLLPLSVGKRAFDFP
jgi:hypothetical protein